MKKLISIVTPCYNEELNIRECVEAVRILFEGPLKDYDYEHILCDNASTDRTAEIMRELARDDQRVRIILNSRNFGPFANLYNGIINTSGDGVVAFLPADLQDPPEVIPDMVKAWEQGYEVVYGVRHKREENSILSSLRRLYYQLVDKWSHIHIPRNAGEFQLIDRKVVEALRRFDDYYPYIRAMIAACGFRSTGVRYTWKARKRGVSSNTLYRLFDYAINGLISTSNVPIRICMLLGFLIALASICAAFVITIQSLIFYRQLAPPGIPMLIVSLFFFSGIQLFFLGVLGEYISAVHSQVRKRPLVIERERLNFN